MNGKNRTIGAKVSSQEGNSPDWSLRGPSSAYVQRWLQVCMEKVGLEAAIY